MNNLADTFDFENEVKIFNDYNQDIQAPFEGVIRRSQNQLYKLRKQILINDFESIESEVAFFKETKNRPLEILICASELKSFEAKFPKGNESRQKKFVLRNIEKVNTFFRNNLEFCHYVKKGLLHFDEFYYTRKHFSKFSSLLTPPFFRDPDFSTSHDLLLAKYNANLKILHYLENRLHKLKNPSFKKLNTSDLKWTSSKTALTELTYALYHGGAVNNGNTDIREIATALEQTFNFPIGDVYRTYSDIRSRKNRKSKFLDELSSSLITGMDAMEE